MTGKKTGAPYLSIIISSRNDDHGGNMLRRLHVSLNSMAEQLEKFCIESEIIFVEWNPPTDKPSMKEVVQWPTGLNYCTIRFIEVSPSIHQRYASHDKIPIHATVAVNSGIKRARGKFILPGTMDNLYPDEVMSFIASKKLCNNHRYRVDRCNVDRKVLELNSLKEQMGFCKQNILQRDYFRINTTMEADKTFPQLHTNACGDFQLMSRDCWHILRGYREADIPAAHVDSLLSYASYAAGVNEIILNDPMCVYHIDHDNKFNERINTNQSHFLVWVASYLMPGVIRRNLAFIYSKFADKIIRSEAKGVPTLSYWEYLKYCRNMVSGRRSYVFNDEGWGLGEEKLPETIISAAKWDQKPYEG